MTPGQISAMSRGSLLSYACLCWPGYEMAEHHIKIAKALMRVEAGECKRLIITMPPRHGKSMLASEFFPAWYMGRNPRKQLIHVSYAQDMVDGFGRKIRNLMKSEPSILTFPEKEARLSEDSQAASRFHTEAGGVYYAVGAGGPITGRGADLLLIDDPIKGREEADSDLQRQKLKEWYSSVAYTRLMPDAKIVLIQCMTGDTPVMMADGSEKMLRDVRVGDRVATYDDGRLSTSVVSNFASNGPDLIYEIKTTSGKIVKANARHPFLVNDSGELKWVKTKDLRRGQGMLRVSGESGKVRPAHGTGAISPSDVVGTAIHTTTRNDGLMALDRRHVIRNQSLGLAQSSSIDTGLRSMITGASSLIKAGCVQYVGAVQRTLETLSIGMKSCVSIIVTTLGRLGGFCATTATSSSSTETAQKFCKQQSSISDFTLDEIESVTECGTEEVFDVQIDRTENFIANGLVSHNTRWHEDDLAGWILEQHGHEEWEVLSLPALDDDGRALWPEAYPAERLHDIRLTIGPRDWESLYQQRPRAASGGEFKRHWIQYYSHINAAGMPKIILVDPASGKRQNNDYTSMWVVALGDDDNYYPIDIVRDRLNLTERAAMLFNLHRKWRPNEVRYERYGMMADIEYLRAEMDRTNYRFAVTEVAGATSKEDRIRRLVPLFERGRVWMPRELHYTGTDGKTRDLVHDFIEQEYLAFPVGRHDDMLDGLARISEPTMTLPWPSKQAIAMQTRIPDFTPSVSGTGM